MLLRGEDTYGYYTLDEQPPAAAGDAAALQCHDRAVALYRAKATECGNSTAWRHG
jgi:hypothetical protein